MHPTLLLYNSNVVMLSTSVGDEVEGIIFSCRYLSSFRRIDAIWRSPARYIDHGRRVLAEDISSLCMK
jgi:hypothetical protein